MVVMCRAERVVVVVRRALTDVRLGQAMWTSDRAWKPCQQMALSEREDRCICFSLELAPAPRLHVCREGHRKSTCRNSHVLVNHFWVVFLFSILKCLFVFKNVIFTPEI